jgi:hypothetical protein
MTLHALDNKIDNKKPAERGLKKNTARHGGDDPRTVRG